MKKKAYKHNWKFAQRIRKIFYIFLIISLVAVSFGYLHILAVGQASPIPQSKVKDINYKGSITTQFIPLSAVEDSLANIKANKQKQILQKIKQDKLNRIEALFKRYNSPMSGYGELIYDRATECGGDYRVIVGIAGNESGLGRVPIKLYNPFGYIDHVQYKSWYDSLNYLSCVIARRFLKPCNNDLACIVKTYGGPETNREKWINHVTYFINQL